jgi:Uma2 family endonuclease
METIEKIGKIDADTFRSAYFDDTDEFYYELLEGEMIKRSAPAIIHQRILRKLMVAINSFVESNNGGEIFCAPIDVILDNYNVLQPDLIFISASQGEILSNIAIKGAPDLVIEILSPTSVVRDRFAKKRIYERSGIKEYWLVSPEYAEIEVFVLKDKRYELFCAATKTEGKFESGILKDIQLDLTQIFPGDTE